MENKCMVTKGDSRWWGEMSWEFGINIYLLPSIGEGNGTPLQYSCLKNPLDGGAWKAAVHGVAEGRTQLSNFTFAFHFHALEKEMATHSSVLAWRIPGTGEPGGPPYGSQSRTQLKRLTSTSKLCIQCSHFSVASKTNIKNRNNRELYSISCNNL